MEYTGNYHLNQWAMTDRIRMEDFNSDNQKIDAALKAAAEAQTAEAGARAAGDSAEAAARQALAAELRPRAGAHLITSGTVSTQCTSFDISTAGIDWSQWKTVCLVLDINGGPVQVKANGSETIGGTSSSNAVAYERRTLANILLCPMFDTRSTLSSVCLTGDSSNGVFKVNRRFKDLSYIQVVTGNSSILAGSSYKLWGEK